MRIQVLTASGVRNLAPLQLEPRERFNVFVGDNGQGKTNLLEAIYAVAALRSFRTSKLADMIALGAPEGHQDVAAVAVAEQAALRQVRTQLVELHQVDRQPVGTSRAASGRARAPAAGVPPAAPERPVASRVASSRARGEAPAAPSPAARTPGSASRTGAHV